MYGEGRQNALTRLQREIQMISIPALVVSTDAPWIVPFERNPRFTGRETLLAQLEDKLFAKDHTTRIAIAGLGGVGKTQLALELLFRIKEKHKTCPIIWIPATSAESLHQGYLEAARQLGIPGWEDDKKDVRKLVQEHLSKESAGQWLLVFDNADDVNIWMAVPRPGPNTERESRPGSGRLMDYLPRNKQGCIIFTTRDRTAAVKLAGNNIIELEEMNEDTAVQLLKSCLTRPNLVENHHDTKMLLAELTYLPLAIVQAAAYINEKGIVLADYLLLLEEKEEEIVDLLSEDFQDNWRYHNVKNPVATTWLISFEQILENDPLAAEYLSFMACIGPKDIPQSLLPPGPSRKKEIDAIGTLTAYSFVSRRPADLALDLHRLVHLATRNWLRKEELLGLWMEKTITRLEEVFPDDDHENRSIWRMYLPHVRQALESGMVSKDEERTAALLWRYGKCLHSDGRWNEAEMAFSQIRAVEMRTLGVEHPDTLATTAWLASTYTNQGRLEEAEKLQVQVVEKNRTKLGADHPSTLISISNLAATYRHQGRWEEAEKLEVQVIETFKTKLGADHPSTLASMANLGVTYSMQGRQDKAEPLKKQVVETRKTKLGADHPSTLTSMANLASTYWNQGRLEEAEKLEVQVMETSKTKLGADHPNTLSSMHNLAFTLKAQGRDTEAIQLMTDCVQRRRHVLGAHNPHFLSSDAALTDWTKDGYGPEGPE
jgi:tetratricopeptide (TPR) repeat protein